MIAAHHCRMPSNGVDCDDMTLVDAPPGFNIYGDGEYAGAIEEAIWSTSNPEDTGRAGMSPTLQGESHREARRGPDDERDLRGDGTHPASVCPYCFRKRRSAAS